MSYDLPSLRTAIVDALQLAVPGLANVYPEDPREGFGWERKVLDGRSVRTWFIDDIIPSAEPLIDSSDFTVLAEIVGLRSVSEGSKAALADEVQLVTRRLRAIPNNRAAVSAGINTTTVAGKYPSYQVIVSARFYALQSVS